MSPAIKDYLDKLAFTFYAFLALPLLLFPMVYLPIKDALVTTNLFQDAQGLAYCLVAGLLLASLYFAHRLYRRNLTVISVQWPIAKKLQAYRRVSVVFYGFGLVASLLSVMLLWVTRHQLFVACYPILLLILSFYRPTIQRLKRELPLSEEDLSVINDQR